MCLTHCFSQSEGPLLEYKIKNLKNHNDKLKNKQWRARQEKKQKFKWICMLKRK